MTGELVIGRIVHFVADEEHELPAIVTHSWESSVNLMIFTDGSFDLKGDFVLRRTSVLHDSQAREPGTWHWPEED
jgi:hypothetical protein